MSDLKLFQDYAKAYAKVREAEKTKEALADKVKAYLHKHGKETTEASVGVFTIYEKATYKYSDKVKKLQEKEKAEGIATKTVSEALKFSPKVQ